MSGFEKTKLATGEFRGEYIQRRLKDGAPVKTIVAEINAPGLYAGPEGKTWPESVVYSEKRKLDAVQRPAAAKPAKELDFAPAATAEVPAEFQGILTSEDVAEVQAEAAALVEAERRKNAKKALLAKAKQDLERQARLAAEEGAERIGDMVDVHIDLAPFAPSIVLDGKVYEHGRMYRVHRPVYNVLMEQIQRSWQHQEGLQGNRDENAYRQHRNVTINGRTGGVSGAQGLRA